MHFDVHFVVYGRHIGFLSSPSLSSVVSSLLCSKSRKCSHPRNHRGKCDKKRVSHPFWSSRKALVVKDAVLEATTQVKRELDDVVGKQVELNAKRQRVDDDLTEARHFLEDAKRKSGKGCTRRGII